MTATNMSIFQVSSMGLKTKTGRELNLGDWLHDYADRVADAGDQEKLHLIADAFEVLKRGHWKEGSSLGWLD